jgi:hypothetical protein
MTEDTLRAYALRGLNARLIELDLERARIVELLGAWGRPRRAPSRASSAAPVERKKQAPPRPEPEHHVVSEAAVHAPLASDVDEARVLPRRRRPLAREQGTTVPVPSLPPMPRLVKARAS